MRKVLTGAAIATVLAAAPALASGAGSEAALRVGDRVGATAGAQKDYLPKAAIAVIAFTGLGLTVWAWDHSRHDDDDSPVSLGA